MADAAGGPGRTEPPAPLDDADDSTHGAVDQQVLEGEEDRKRIVALKALLSSYAISTLVLLIQFEGAKQYRFLVLLCVANALFAGALLTVARRRRYPDLVSAGIGVSGAAFALAGCVYFGVNSAAVVGLPVLVYYFGMVDSALRRRVVVSFVLAGYALVVLLTVIQVIPARGLAGQARPDATLVFDATTMSVIVLQIVALTYWLARKSRRSTLLAMAALEQARAKIRQRDALLNEANANLDRVIAGARSGRYTGQKIGHFDVGDVIGRGAIGEVYAAEHRETKQAVAVKVLHSHLQHESGHLQRFFREVEVTGSLLSRHIPRTIESGLTPDGGPYLAMELLSGSDLATELRHKKRLPLDEIDGLVAEVASALGVAHAAGVVHRDVKPQNLFRTRSHGATWKVLDFGVSKLLAGSGTLTGGAAVGTPAYMAPEQVAGGNVDARADLFALAAVIYRALTGRPAFSGPSELATMMRVSTMQPNRPGELANVHEHVDAFFAVALAKDPERRIPSAVAFSAAWGRARRGQLEPELLAVAERILALQPWGSELQVDEPTTVLAAPTQSR